MARRHPVQAVTDMVSEINRMRQLGRTGYEPPEATGAAPWVPAADIFARGDDVVVCLELAGIGPQDVDITFADGVLTVSGELVTGEREDDAHFYVRERPSGPFRRSMTFPASVDADDISASTDNGLVRIVVRGAATAAAPRRITVTEGPGER